MNFQLEFKVVTLRLLLTSEKFDGIHLIEGKHLHGTQSSLAPLVFEGYLADIISGCRANSSSLTKISKIDQTSMCRMQPRLVLSGSKGDEFRSQML